jgi:hypothetical protein
VREIGTAYWFNKLLRMMHHARRMPASVGVLALLLTLLAGLVVMLSSHGVPTQPLVPLDTC